MAVRNEVLEFEGEGVKATDVVRIYRWDNLQAGDTGRPVIVPFFPDNAIALVGVNGHTVTMQAQIDTAAAPTFQTVHDPLGTALVLTANDIRQILESFYQFRPSVVGGVGAVQVWLKVMRIGP